jgi:hypothetical protein
MSECERYFIFNKLGVEDGRDWREENRL